MVMHIDWSILLLTLGISSTTKISSLPSNLNTMSLLSHMWRIICWNRELIYSCKLRDRVMLVFYVQEATNLTSTWLPTNWSPNFVRAWQVASPCSVSGSILFSLSGDSRGPNVGPFSPDLMTLWAPMKSKPSLVSVPVLSKQKMRIFPAIAMRLGFKQKMPRACKHYALLYNRIYPVILNSTAFHHFDPDSRVVQRR